MKTLGTIASEMHAVTDLRGIMHHMMETRRAYPDEPVETFVLWYEDLVRTLLNHTKLPPIWADVYAPKSQEPSHD